MLTAGAVVVELAGECGLSTAAFSDGMNALHTTGFYAWDSGEYLKYILLGGWRDWYKRCTLITHKQIRKKKTSWKTYALSRSPSSTTVLNAMYSIC